LQVVINRRLFKICTTDPSCAKAGALRAAPKRYLYINSC
jgi:hypothetical protein